MIGERWRWLRLRLRGLFGRHSHESGLSDEMRHHLDMLVEEKIAEGLSPRDARLAAQREFGAIDAYREECRDTWRLPAIGDLMRSTRFAARSLLRTPGFTAITILTLALGIGMNSAMFSMLNGYLLRPLDYPEPEQLFRLFRSTPQQPENDHSFANFGEIARDSRDVAELAGIRTWGFTLTETNHPADLVFSLRVTSNFFDVVGVVPAHGRSFLPEEEREGRNNVIIISHQYWQTRFDGDPGILGRQVRIDGTPVEIVGVVPARSDLSRVFPPVSVFRPLGATTTELNNRSETRLGIVGRYHDGVGAAQAASVFDTISLRLNTDYPAENAGDTLNPVSLQSTTLVGRTGATTYLLLGLAAIVLLIACANLANLFLARALSRSREFSIRAALGASRRQLIKPLVIESLLLSAAGGVAAILISVWTSDWLAQRFVDPNGPVRFSLDGRVLAFTAITATATALLFGLAPAWWSTRTKLNEALKSGSRGTVGSRNQQRYRHTLIVAQFTLSLVLLAGAGFFIRGLERLSQAATGWDRDRVIAMTLNLTNTHYLPDETTINFHQSLRRLLLAIPGVENAAVSRATPLDNPSSVSNWLVEGRQPPPPGQESVAFTNAVSDSFFDTVGISLLQGRAINPSDRIDSRRVVVINEAMARALFPSKNPIGQRISEAGLPAPNWAEIVGVVANTRATRVQPSSIRFQVYKPYPQEAWKFAVVTVRAESAGIMPSLLKPIGEAVSALDAELPIRDIAPVAEHMRSISEYWQTINQLLILFASLGLALAALGIYGVVTRLVAQRTGEIGVRMALGAQVRDILTLVLAGGLRTASVGVALGIAGALYLSHHLSKTLPAFGGQGIGISLMAGLLLLFVAFWACFLPAQRATKVNPVVALRNE